MFDSYSEYDAETSLEEEPESGWLSTFGGMFYQPMNSDGTYSRFSDYVDPDPEIPF